MVNQSPAPFLRWAGGKKWLLKHFNEYLPDQGFNNYHELFLGGGAIYFYLQPKRVSYLNDLNEELIDTYQCVKEDVEGVINELRKFENTEKFYYELRSRNFRNEIKKAARFIFLNQTSYNGIYRVNSKGKYNVPYGYRKKDFFEPDNLRIVSQNLINAHFTSRDFTECIENVKRGDLVFLDPPYTITHNNNGFFKYNSKLFSEQDQYTLSETIKTIKSIGAFYVLTNAAHNKVREIFDLGDSVFELKRASLVGGTKAERGIYSEFIFTNTR